MKKGSYFSQFFYRGHAYQKPDPRKFWMSISWIIFIGTVLFKIGLIIYDCIGNDTHTNQLIEAWFLGILGGKATFASGAYIANKKVINGNSNPE